MSNIVETLELQDSSNEIIYLIKFEQLIPRLQKYYNFEVYRDTLKSFDVRIDTKKILTTYAHGDRQRIVSNKPNECSRKHP